MQQRGRELIEQVRVVDPDDRMLVRVNRFSRCGQECYGVAGGGRADEVSENPQRDRARRLRSGHPMHARRQRLCHRPGQRGLTDSGVAEKHNATTALLADESRANEAELIFAADDRPGVHLHEQRFYWRETGEIA